jgi:hypothetical protein
MPGCDPQRAKKALTEFREPSAVHVQGSSCRAPISAQPSSRFCKPAVDGVIVEPLEEAIRGGVIRRAWQLQRFAQFAKLARTHLGVTKGPTLVGHQIARGQQLRLSEAMFAGAKAVGHKTGWPLARPRGQRALDRFRPSSLLLRQKTCTTSRRLCSNVQSVPRMSTEPPEVAKAYPHARSLQPIDKYFVPRG